ncbi:phage tail assembly protein [Klebsiella pneumoniae]|uniref:phage tail assembly protein n=1 Tax=Klebsiella pneumoniae TaxID=573 RepID=UPI002416D96C|nr:phage tail assembly protein [Klebsiella pneumoniae]
MSELLTEKTESIVILDTPVQRGATSIREVVLRKPQSGALRGLRLQAVMEMDVASMMTIIPRILDVNYLGRYASTTLAAFELFLS